MFPYRIYNNMSKTSQRPVEFPQLHVVQIPPFRIEDLGAEVKVCYEQKMTKQAER